jgi:hypothetical protein
MDVTDLTASGGKGLLHWMRRAAQGVYEGVTRTVRRWLEPFAPGFAEHEWTGKLFLISGGVGVAGTIGGYVGGVIVTAVTQGFGVALVAMTVAGSLGVAITVSLQRWFLLGIARFRRWANIVAVVITGGGLLHGLGSLVAIILSRGQPGIRGLVLAIAETCMSAQFLIYFARAGDRFTPAGTTGNAPIVLPHPSRALPAAATGEATKPDDSAPQATAP